MGDFVLADNVNTVILDLKAVAGLTHFFLFVHLCIGFTLVLEDWVPACIVWKSVSHPHRTNLHANHKEKGILYE